MLNFLKRNSTGSGDNDKKTNENSSMDIDEDKEVIYIKEVRDNDKRALNTYMESSSEKKKSSEDLNDINVEVKVENNPPEVRIETEAKENLLSGQKNE
jgi:hypothetical protein